MMNNYDYDVNLVALNTKFLTLKNKVENALRARGHTLTQADWNRTYFYNDELKKANDEINLALKMPEGAASKIRFNKANARYKELSIKRFETILYLLKSPKPTTKEVN